MNRWFIPGNVPSSKNSKVWTGKFLVSSSTCTKYMKNTADFWRLYGIDFRKKTKGLPKPLNIQFLFVRDSKRRFDYINPAQTVQDMMVKYDWIDDDNCDEIVPLFLPYSYSKTEAGVYIISE